MMQGWHKYTVINWRLLEKATRSQGIFLPSRLMLHWIDFEKYSFRLTGRAWNNQGSKESQKKYLELNLNLK